VPALTFRCRGSQGADRKRQHSIPAPGTKNRVRAPALTLTLSLFTHGWSFRNAYSE
jgi:hypothetical protein